MKLRRKNTMRPLPKGKEGFNITPFIDVLLATLIIFVLFTPMISNKVNVDLPKANRAAVGSPETPRKPQKHTSPDASDADKNACKDFEPGTLDFKPTETMDQGKSYMVEAKLQRKKPVAPVAKTDDGREIREVTLACKVELALESDEEGDFDIKAVPAGTTFQRVDVDSFTSWQWRVRPLHSGELYLLLYVIPVQSEAPADLEKHFEAPPIKITVRSRRWYGFIAVSMKYATLITPLETALLAIFTALLTGIIIFHYQRNRTKNDPKPTLVASTSPSSPPPSIPAPTEAPRPAGVVLTPTKTGTIGEDIAAEKKPLQNEKT